MNATGDCLYDVAVVGLGPAGRALASRCAEWGLSVLAIDPQPHAPWRQTLSLWADQVPPWLAVEVCGVDVLAHSVSRPALYSPDRSVLDRVYCVFDNAALRQALPLNSNVTVETEAVDDAQLLGLTARAHRVVDCRGAGGARNAGPMQTAHGIVLSAVDAAPALCGEPALFMDWRTDYDDDEAGPSFLYAIPLDGDRVLLEETCLAGLPAPAPAILAARLRSRLLRRGVAPAAIDEPLAVERVRIPLQPRGSAGRVGAGGTGIGGSGEGDPRIESFGTAGGHGHAATGYSVAAMLAAVPGAVHALVSGFPIPAPRSTVSTALQSIGLRALLRADSRTLRQLFNSFGRLEPRRQQWFLEGASPFYQLARSMWDMWVRMPIRGKAGMVAAVLSKRPREAGVGATDQ